jgi:putative membrane protein
MMHWMNGGGGYYMWFVWIFWLILLGVIIWAVVTIINKSQNAARNVQPGESALGILKKRFAKGEINKEQFDQMKTVLKE